MCLPGVVPSTRPRQQEQRSSEGGLLEHVTTYSPSPSQLREAIKLKEDPTDEDLARELQLVLGNFDTFVADDRDITVVLERKRRSSPATRVSL